MKLSVRLTSRDRNRLCGSTVFKQRANLLLPALATSVTFPSSELVVAHSMRFQQLSLLISIFATIISMLANELFDTCCRHQPEMPALMTHADSGIRQRK
jgi:hypothetical protein